MGSLRRKVLSSIERRGFVATFLLSVRRAPDLLSYWADHRYDRTHGAHTVGVVPLRELLAPDDQRARDYRYEPTGVRTFRKLTAKVQPPRNVGFVDYGCGRGRTLLLAADYGFERVTGIEFVPALVETARENIEAYRTRTSSSSSLDVREVDATVYEPSEADAVFYFYNPFNAEVLEPVLEQILASQRRHPRPMWLVYHNPIYRELMDRRPELRLAGTYCFERYDVLVYEVAPA